MRFECTHCHCKLAVEIDWNDRSEVPVQCGKCEGISVLKSKARSEPSHTIPAPSVYTPPEPKKVSPPPFRATDIKVPSFLKERAEESLRAFDSEFETELAPSPNLKAEKNLKSKKWIAIVGALAIISGSYLIWNATRIAKKTYRFSQEAREPSQIPAQIAN